MKPMVNRIISFNWNNRIVYIGIQVAEVLGYENPSKVINYFIKKSNLINGVDYEIIKGDELRSFKRLLMESGISKYKLSPSLLLFYDKSFKEFLSSSDKLTTREVDKLISVYESNNTYTNLDEEDYTNDFDENNKVKDNQLIKGFKGYEISTYTWNGKPCWIANDIAKVLGYKDESSNISRCISAEFFEIGYEYEILVGSDLDNFKKVTENFSVTLNKYLPKLTIFYEDGLYGFLQYSHKPIAIEFKKWIRREVLPALREKGTYSINNDLVEENLEENEESLSKSVRNKLKNKHNLHQILEALTLIDSIISKENDSKLRYLKEILES